MTKISSSSTPHTLHLKLNPIYPFSYSLPFHSSSIFLHLKIIIIQVHNQTATTVVIPFWFLTFHSYLPHFFIHLKNKKSSTQPNYYCCCDEQ